ncbi:hypothetical protein [Mycoplasmopsis agassizii]|nr:hypothetical protein [Mycoplasmopsis agassizii]
MDKVHFVENIYKKEGLKKKLLLHIEGEDMEEIIIPPVPPVPPVPPSPGGGSDNEYATVGYVKQVVSDLKEEMVILITDSEERNKVFVKQEIADSEERTKIYVKEIVDKAVKEATDPIIAELVETRKENKENKKTLDKILALMEESNKKK